MRWSFALLSLACCSASADRPSGAPAMVVRVSTDFAVPTAIDALEIRVDAGGVTTFDRAYALPADAKLPGTLTLASTGNGTPPPGNLSPGTVPAAATGATVVITIRGSLRAVPVASRSARFVMPSSQHALDLSLDAACSMITCGDGQTCIAGACAPVDVDASKLPGFGT